MNKIAVISAISKTYCFARGRQLRITRFTQILINHLGRTHYSAVHGTLVDFYTGQPAFIWQYLCDHRGNWPTSNRITYILLKTLRVAGFKQVPRVPDFL